MAQGTMIGSSTESLGGGHAAFWPSFQRGCAHFTTDLRIFLGRVCPNSSVPLRRLVQSLTDEMLSSHERSSLPMGAIDRIIYKSLVKGTMLVARRNFVWVVVNS